MIKYIIGILFLSSQVFSICEPIEIPTENSIEVSPGDDLRGIILSAPEGSTILLNSGHYKISQTIFINQDNITLMSKARHRDSVVLDGNMGSTPLDPLTFTNEIVAVRGNNSTVAHLTICYAQHHGIHAYPSSSATENKKGIHLYDLRVFDCGQQLIKVNSNGNADNLHWIDEGILECSLIEFVDNSVMQEETNYFYTGGIDVHGGENWIVRNNTFQNIERESKLMEHAIHFWSKSRGTIVDNNHFINVYRAIGFGMKTVENGNIERHYADGLGDDPYFDHINGIIRNNVLHNESGIHLETGIELMNVHNVQVYNNTIFSEDTPFNSLEYRWPNTTVTIKNNLLSHNIMPRNGASGTVEANLENCSNSLFVDPQNHDFHLKESAVSAIGTGVVLSDSLFGVDIDGEKMDESAELGADQHTPNNVIVANNIPHSGIHVLLKENRLELRGLGTQGCDLSLFNIQGKNVMNSTILSSNESVVLPIDFASGIYFVKLKNELNSQILQFRVD